MPQPLQHGYHSEARQGPSFTQLRRAAEAGEDPDLIAALARRRPINIQDTENEAPHG